MNAVEVLCLKGLPYDVALHTCLLCYAGHGVDCLVARQDWMFSLPSFYPLLDGEQTWLYCSLHGNLEVIKILHANKCDGYSIGVAEHASFYGYMDLLEWVYLHHPEDILDYNMHMAAVRGHLSIAAWMYEKIKKDFPRYVMDVVASKGMLTMVQWLHSIGQCCTTNAMDYAAEHGHLNVIVWLSEHRSEGCTTRAMNSAAQNGYLNVVKWLHENRKEGCTQWAMKGAELNGHNHVVEWLYLNRKEE